MLRASSVIARRAWALRTVVTVTKSSGSALAFDAAQPHSNGNHDVGGDLSLLEKSVPTNTPMQPWEYEAHAL